MPPIAPPRRFERVLLDPPYAVDALPGAGDILVIAFSSIGHDPDRPPSPEFVATALSAGGPALFVTDASRSWAQAPGFATVVQDAVARISARQPVRRIACIGLSMGAVMALQAARVVPADVVLAFGPQSHLHGDARWSRWTGALAPLAPPLQTGATRVVLFHGLVDDHAQALGFPPAPGTDHILFAGLTHAALVPHLRTRGVLAGLLAAALDGDRRRLLRIAASCGGRVRRRVSP